MTTLVNVLKDGEFKLPECFRKRNKIKPGTTLRVTEVGGGLYVTPDGEGVARRRRPPLIP